MSNVMNLPFCPPNDIRAQLRVMVLPELFGQKGVSEPLIYAIIHDRQDGSDMYVSEMQRDANLLYGFRVAAGKRPAWNILEPSKHNPENLQLERVNEPVPLRQVLKTRHQLSIHPQINL
jgi:hypothetical protein